MIDETHDRSRQSWVASANGHAVFPLQNLPFGVFSPPGRNVPDAKRRGGIAIGDMIFDLRAAREAGLFTGLAAAAAEAASGDSLNPLMALGAAPRRELRKQVSALLAAGGPGQQGPSRLPAACCTAPAIAGCTCRQRSTTSPISLPASTTRETAAAAATRTTP